MKLVNFVLLIIILQNNAVGLGIENPTVIKIGGIFALDGGENLGNLERFSAFQMAIDEINANDQLLRGYKLVGMIEDSFSNANIGEQGATSLIEDGVVAIIGPMTSRVSLTVGAQSSKRNRIPLISPSATSTLLSDKESYPYFVRLAVSDIYQSQAVFELIEEFGWSLISTISSDDPYGQGNVEPIINSKTGNSLGVKTLADQAKEFGIVIDKQIKITEVGSNIEANLKEITKGKSKVIFINLISNDALPVLREIANMNLSSKAGYVWIGSDGVSQIELVSKATEIQSVLQGMIGISPLIGVEPLLSTFLDKWENCFGQNASVFFGCGDREPNNYVTYTYDSVYLLAMALEDMISDNLDYRNGDLLLESIYKQEFVGITGPIKLNDFGDRNGVYSIVNLQSSSFNKIGTWDEIEGLKFFNRVFWDGDSNGSFTEIPRGVDKLNFTPPSFIVLFLIVLVKRKNKVKMSQ